MTFYGFFLHCFVFESHARTGQTDRRTDGRVRRLMRPIRRPHDNTGTVPYYNTVYDKLKIRTLASLCEVRSVVTRPNIFMDCFIYCCLS